MGEGKIIHPATPYKGIGGLTNMIFGIGKFRALSYRLDQEFVGSVLSIPLDFFESFDFLPGWECDYQLINGMLMATVDRLNDDDTFDVIFLARSGLLFSESDSTWHPTRDEVEHFQFKNFASFTSISKAGNSNNITKTIKTTETQTTIGWIETVKTTEQTTEALKNKRKHLMSGNTQQEAIPLSDDEDD